MNDTALQMAAERLVHELSAAPALAARTGREVSLGRFTTFGVGGPALVHAEVHSTTELLMVCNAASSVGLPVATIGQGSNLLIADTGVAAAVITMAGEFQEISIAPTEHGAEVVAGAAVKLPILARQTVLAGLSGFEWAVGVPGSVGGAIRMNAGGHGSDMRASVVSATVVDTTSHPVLLEERPAQSLVFAYRSSAITSTDVVAAARLRLGSGSPAIGERELKEIVRWRREHQPGGANCGSVFTNPEGDSAGRLIDEAGLKGHRVGTAQVSTKHANFIQADPDARAEDICALIIVIQTTILDRFGVRLHAEVQTLGIDSMVRPQERRAEA
jgi:UDP-N-acetylmuramate dehydrogenase